MRAGRAFTAGRGQSPLIVLPNGFMRRKLEPAHPLAADQKFAQALARQLNYANEAFNFNNGAQGYAATGYGGQPAGFNSVVNGLLNFSQAIYVMPSGTPTVPVWLVNEEKPIGEVLAAEETLRTGEYNEKIQALLTAVPLPDLSKLLFGQIGATGTDSQAVIWQPGVGLWEFHRLTQFTKAKEENGHKISIGDWKCGFGGFHNPATWNGIGENAAGYTSASGVFIAGGTITYQDLVEVLRGGPIRHALDMPVIVRRNEGVPPAIAHDSGSNTFKEWTNGKAEKVVNPAHAEPGYETKAKEEEAKSAEGWRDAIPEGSMYRFPSSATPEEFGLTGVLEQAIFVAIRDYGLIVRDGGGTCALQFEDYHNQGSPYCWNKVNPLAGAHTGQSAARMEALTATIGAAFTDPSLPVLKENFSGTASCVYALWQKCANSLQQIEPFSS